MQPHPTLPGWASRPGGFSQIAIHNRCYRELREQYGLSAQMAVRAIGKAVEVFARDKSRCPAFRPDGAITYDERILSFKGVERVSLWTLKGRKVLLLVYGEYQKERLGRIKGQVDLVYQGGRFYLYATVDLPEGAPVEVQEFVGIDLGVVHLATTSDGDTFSGEAVERVRLRYTQNWRRLQRKAAKRKQCGKRPKNVRRKLKRMAKREARFRKNENHRISKQIVSLAEDTQRGMAMEDLRHIRSRIRFRKAQRARMGGWAFAQLQGFLAYKAKLRGLPFARVHAAYTSQTCAVYGHCEKANRPEQARFVCTSCGHAANADVNGAQNIALRAAVNRPEVSKAVRHLAA